MHGKTVIIQFEHDEQRHITKISYIMRTKGVKFNVNDARKKRENNKWELKMTVQKRISV